MNAEFDSHADSYREQVDRAISFVGKDVEFFAESKAQLLEAVARRRIGDPADLSVLDVGCGIGLVDGYLVDRFRAVAGVDVSASELALARERHPRVSYALAESGVPHESNGFDLAFAACVLHHLGERERAAFVSEMARVVRPGGLVVVIEHNPLNPLTRLVVSRVAFDAGVSLLRAGTVVSLAEGAGLEKLQVVNTTFLPLRGRLARRVEEGLARVPLGAQYAVVARKVGP